MGGTVFGPIGEFAVAGDGLPGLPMPKCGVVLVLISNSGDLGVFSNVLSF